MTEFLVLLTLVHVATRCVETAIDYAELTHASAVAGDWRKAALRGAVAVGALALAVGELWAFVDVRVLTQG